jgi:SAM-dependent methyltransferase
MTDSEFQARLAQYKFYHTIQVTESLCTAGAPEHQISQQPVLAEIKKLDLAGKKVLDVGCRDGLYSFLAEQRGAEQIIGIDHDLSLGAVELLIPYMKSKVRMHQMNLLDLKPETFGQFDVIIFAGVLYHLRYPFWSLKLLRDVMRPGGMLVLETAVFYGQDKFPMLYCPTGNNSPYEATSCTFFNRQGLTETLQSLGWKVLSSSVLHPAAEGVPCTGDSPVVDRAVFVCQYVADHLGTIVENYWTGLHSLHTQFGGDVAAVEQSAQLS